jgi:hypothetical protein
VIDAWAGLLAEASLWPNRPENKERIRRALAILREELVGLVATA